MKIKIKVAGVFLILIFSLLFVFCHAENSIDSVGRIGQFVLDYEGYFYSEKSLLSALLDWTWECKDWDSLNALKRWLSSADVELISYTESSGNQEYGEKYSFNIHINDAFISKLYNVSFDCFDYPPEPDENENYYDENYIECSIDPISSSTNIQDVLWTSRETEACYFQFDKRPDGQVGIEEHRYYSINMMNPWTTYYNTITWDPVDDPWNNKSYGYTVELNNTPVMLYPDGTIYYHDRFEKRFYYPEGMEEQEKAVVLSTGNTFGLTSSNLFNGGRYAIEGDKIVFIDNGQVYRSDLDGNNLMCLYSGSYDNEIRHIRCMNLINGECYFIDQGEEAFGIDLNGNELFNQKGKIESLVANNESVFFTVRWDSSWIDAGLYRYDKSSKKTTQLANIESHDIALDGDWIYFDDIDQQNLYRIKQDGTSLQTVVEGNRKDGKTGGFIVENGIILYYCLPNTVLYYQTINSNDDVSVATPVASHDCFGGSYSYVGNEYTKVVALRNRWIYYYYPRDNSMICRMTIDGSITDEFVCYTDYRNEGIYIFGNDIYLAGEDNIQYMMTVSD